MQGLTEEEKREITSLLHANGHYKTPLNERADLRRQHRILKQKIQTIINKQNRRTFKR